MSNIWFCALEDRLENECEPLFIFFIYIGIESTSKVLIQGENTNRSWIALVTGSYTWGPA